MLEQHLIGVDIASKKNTSYTAFMRCDCCFKELKRAKKLADLAMEKNPEWCDSWVVYKTPRGFVPREAHLTQPENPELRDLLSRSYIVCKKETTWKRWRSVKSNQDSAGCQKESLQLSLFDFESEELCQAI